MRFRKLRLTGFKSFVEPAELLIEPGLTGIVGPNGCGKSNLLEAIRWVMGEASPKSLRGGGMEDVIFAGTASRPARDFAEVALLAEVRDDAIGGWSEREVVRRIERGAGSAYRLNGRDVRQRDVALLFADAATGAHSPALVSQGRIAAVVAARPQQRREMLEEAAGIAGLHVRRKEAETRLRATEANLARLDEILADMATRAGALRRQARLAERYRALSAAIRIAEARALFARWREAAIAADRAQAQAAETERAVLVAAEAQRAAAAHAAAAIAAAAAARSAAEAARDAQAEARHACDRLRQDQGRIDRRLAELATQIAALSRDNDREDRLAIDAAAALRSLEAEGTDLAAAIAAAVQRQDGLAGEAAIAEPAVHDAEIAVARALADAAREEADARVATAAQAAARQRHARAAGEVGRIVAESAALGDAGALAGRLERARAARGSAEAATRTAGATVATAERARDEAAARRDATEATARIATAELARIESEAAALATSLAREAGDTLLDRLRVAPGYEHALAAALGDDLAAPLGMAGGRGWAGEAPRAGDPALPDGVAALAPFVTGGEPLLRRLAQVGVVAHDEGVPLAVGQRIVTTGGALRRWDGFFARDVGAATADRLARANRHDALAAALPDIRLASERARDDRAAAATALDGARRAVDDGRHVLAAAEDALRAARRTEDSDAGAVERHAAAEAALAGRRDRAIAERDEAAVGCDIADRLVAALPDRAITRAAIDRLSRAADHARATLAAARASMAAATESLRRDRQRQQAARAEAEGWRARAGDAAHRIEDMRHRLDTAAAERSGLADRPAIVAAALAGAEHALDEAATAAAARRRDEAAAEAELRRLEALAAHAGEAFAAAREARATIAAHAAHQQERRQDLSRLAGERFQCPAATLAERIGFDVAALEAAAAEGAHHDRLVADRERLGPVNLVAEAELAALDGDHAANIADRVELGEAVHRLRGSIGSLNREGRQRLLAAFEAVDGHFRRLFATLFGGGDAHLALIDSDDPLEAGLEIMAQPPGKKLGSLTLLSGGEQALTAVALIFALFLTNPAPICVLDEVDAPLDDANIERFCDLLIAMTEETATRYLVVTHNAVTMSRMHRLFGVTMIERGVSRLVSVDLGGAETLVAGPGLEAE